MNYCYATLLYEVVLCLHYTLNAAPVYPIYKCIENFYFAEHKQGCNFQLTSSKLIACGTILISNFCEFTRLYLLKKCVIAVLDKL